MDSLVRALGRSRLLTMGGLLLVGFFLLLAMSSVGHFEWGFRWINVAVFLLWLWPVAVLVDTGLLVSSLWRRTRRGEVIDGEARAILMCYAIVTWGPILLLISMLF